MCDFYIFTACENVSRKTNIDATALTEGVYNINIKGNERIENKKLVIVK